MAEEERDFIDDLIDIQQDWQAVSNPFGDIAEALMADPSERKSWDATKYREKPFVNSMRCLNCASDGQDVCSACVDVCPSDSIWFKNSKTIAIKDDCRKCLLCATVCPTDTIRTRSITQSTIYDRIARAASSFTTCYVTCTRAFARLDRFPYRNEIILPCVGAMRRDLWFALLTDYVNISVYLPDGICERCRNTFGEEIFAEEIAAGEQWAQASVGLETEEDELVHKLTRAYKRSQFISHALSAGERLVMGANPTLAGAKLVASKLKAHSDQLLRIQREIEQAVGAKTAQNRQRYLTEGRKLMMAALQHDPGLAESVELALPVVDSTRCTACADCAMVCTPRAIEVTDDGRVRIEPSYCTGCAACALVCPEDALAMGRMDARELIVVDEESERIAAEKAKAKAEAKRLMEQGRKQLEKVGDVLEKLADEDKEQ